MVARSGIPHDATVGKRKAQQAKKRRPLQNQASSHSQSPVFLESRKKANFSHLGFRPAFWPRRTQTPPRMLAGAKKTEDRREPLPKKETTGVLERIAKPTLPPQREHEFPKTTFSAKRNFNLPRPPQGEKRLSPRKQARFSEAVKKQKKRAEPKPTRTELCVKPEILLPPPFWSPF